MKQNSISQLENKTLILVNTGSIKKRFIFQKLKKAGLTLVVLHKEKNWASPYVDHWILADTNNHQECLTNIKSFFKTNPLVRLDGVITFWEDSVLLTAKIVDRFNLIGIPFEIAKKAKNKYHFREFCQQESLPAPRHKLIQHSEDISLISSQLSFPAVVKPVYGAASAFVVKVADEQELRDTYDYIRNNIVGHSESAEWDSLEILVEEYIDGEEVDMDILLQNGKIKFYSISDNDQTSEPFFVETGQSIPSHLPLSNQQSLIEMAEETLEKLGVQNGCIHFEAKTTQNGPVPIEVNLRMGGDEVYSFIKGAWGIDLVIEAAKIALGLYIKKVNKSAMPRKFITGKYFLSEYSGLLAKLDIDFQLKQEKFLEEIHFYKEVGDPVLVPPEGYEYLGWLTVSGENLLDAKDNLQQISRRVHYEVVKFDSNSSFGKTSRKNRFSSAVLNKNLLTRAAKIEKFKRVSSENQGSLRVAVIGNTAIDTQSSPEQELNFTGQEIVETLNLRGYQTVFFNFNDFPKVASDLKKIDIDLIFNVGEYLNQSAHLKPNIASILEALQIPYTGSTPFALRLAQDKIKFKKLLNYHNIPTAKWDYAYSLDDEISENLVYPLIVKPGNSDHAFGISNQSVVTKREQLQEQLRKIIEEFGCPALVEEYIEGDEYDVSILGNDPDDLEVLPLSRSIFQNVPSNYWHIYTYEAKWHKSPAYKDIIIQRPPKSISRKLETLMTEIALDTYNILDCQDYGRVEIRVDSDNNPYVLELNANPSLHPATCLPIVARLIGLDYGDLLEKIIASTIKRYQRRPNINF